MAAYVVETFSTVALLFRFQPALAASQSQIHRAVEDDAKHRFPCPRRELLGAGEEIAGGVIDQNIQRPGIPDLADHPLDGIALAHVADKTANLARCAVSQLAAGLLQDIRPAAADVNRCAELQKTLRHRVAQARAASCDQNAFALEQIWLEHLAPRFASVVVDEAEPICHKPVDL